MCGPLTVQYRTKSGRYYLYDLGTGEIIETDETIDAIAGDYRLLDHDEILLKYEALGRDAVETALRELDALRKEGCLADHPPEELVPVERIVFDGNPYALEEFWNGTASLLILGITERCNLCCEYCCYSGKVEGFRAHGNRTMPYETATKAIAGFLGNRPGSVVDILPITFYGGEPLLEFDLLQRLVAFANERAAVLGKKVAFSVTTNGTLLKDEVTDFLVEHDFHITISFDGARNSHNRYRKFRDGSGSFDLVRSNLRRFAKRHPDHKSRGINMVLAPPLELDAMAALMQEIIDDYPLSRASWVNIGPEHRFPEQAPSTRYGCYTPSDCASSPMTASTFHSLSESDRAAVMRMFDQCVDSLMRVGFRETKQTMPLAVVLFEQQFDALHHRGITTRKPDWMFLIPCLPGFSRRFCDVDGNYRICERVDDSDVFVLGNVRDGLDANKLKRTMELRRHFGDCGNCTAIKTCNLCYARVPYTDRAEAGYDPHYDMLCRQTRAANEATLRTYTEIMESNPHAFDKPYEIKMPRIRYGVFPKPFTPETRKTLECEACDEPF